MAQEGIDTLLSLTDSRYRLSMITARRAAQLKTGIPSILPPEERPKTRNTVTIAMKEVATGRIKWGDDLPTIDEIRHEIEQERRREERPNYSVSSEDDE
ncbi:MAG: DNA-directed RNA polymerase subunit omega [Deinococcota bacterium]|jgi:DNA-directed RNA polymerase subunit omega|nr:DNA-directed RNA polymerase subunit omega [Deinococcota bacterium]